MTDIKQPAKQIDQPDQRAQNHWNLVQLQNTWLAVGIVVLGIAIGIASLSDNSWIAVIILLLFGLLICVFSPKIASLIFQRELTQLQKSAGTNKGRILMPDSIKTLATVAAWVLFILGGISFLCGIVNLILISFNLLSLVSPVTVQLIYIGFGILCFVLAYVAARIRARME